VLPPYLKPGDTIGICAPARKVSREEVNSGIQFLVSNGFHVKLSDHLFGSYNQFSGTDEERIADFQAMIDDDSVSAVLAARGGYGCVRLVDKIDFTKFKAKPKWIIGFSDMTVFSNHLHTNFDIATLHGPMLYNMSGSRMHAEATSSLLRMMKGTDIHYSIDKGPNHLLNRNGNTEGILTGGNLSLIFSLSGTPSDIDTTSKILFIEDLDEYYYHLDRMILQLKRSGKLKSLAGLIVGGMNDMRDNMFPFGKTAEQIIAEAVSEYDYPVCFDFPAGHISRNLPLKLGANVKLSVGETMDLSFS